MTRENEVRKLADELERRNTYGAKYHIRNIQEIVESMRRIAALQEPDTMERVKAECKKHGDECGGRNCPFWRQGEHQPCMVDGISPDEWDIPAIRKALKEGGDDGK